MTRKVKPYYIRRPDPDLTFFFQIFLDISLLRLFLSEMIIAEEPRPKQQML